jgi:hypothetical protein
VLLDDPGRVRSQITSVVNQIQRFDFDCNLAVTRKLMIRIPAGLGLNPLYGDTMHPADYLLYRRRDLRNVYSAYDKVTVALPLVTYIYIY